MNKQNRLSVAHYHPVWLPNTMTWLHELVNGLRQHCKNMVICEQTVNTDRFVPQNLHSFSSLPASRRYMQRLLKKTGFVQSLGYYVTALKNERVDILHSHFGHIAVSGSKIARDAGIPHVASFYGMDLHQIPAADSRWKSRYHEMFNHSRKIFCEGEHMAKCIAVLGCPAEKIIVHPLGIDLDKVPFHPAAWDGKEPLRILIAASFREKKGIPLALEAVSTISDSFPVRVTVIGDASPEETSRQEKKRILETIQKHKMESIVSLRGYVPHSEMLDEARLHHIFLSPSFHAKDGDSEGGAPVGIIEMSASGIMVVSSRHCDIPGVIRHGETGWLAEEGDPGDLVARLMEAAKNRKDWPQIAQNARKHIQTRFDSRKQAAKLYQHYLEVIGG